MAIIRTWANRLWAGTQSWSKCPSSRRAAVKTLMREDVAEANPEYPERTAERFEEITGEPYEV